MEDKSTGASSSNLHLVTHPRAKSKVWKYFGFDTDSDGCILHWKRIYCRICMTQIAYSGNTSNLSYHLEKNHPEEFCEFVKSNTDQMREAFATAYSKRKPEGPFHQQHPQETPKPNLGYENRRHSDLTSAVLSFICEGMYPVSVVEEPTFQALLKTTDPRYSPPTKSDIAKKFLPHVYQRSREAVLSELAGVANCGVSTDLWQSQTQNRTYISLSMHCLNQNCSTSVFSTSSKCLKTFEVQEDNIAENITRALYDAFVEWGITHKVSGVTTNGSLDIVKACSLLDLSVQMPCFGHTVNRGMAEAFQLPHVDSFLGKCRKLVDYFHQSLTAICLLQEKQRLHGLAKCQLVNDRIRSWMSTLRMLLRLREQQPAITSALVEDSDNHHLSFEGTEWSMVEGMIEMLQPFKVVADMMTSCRYPSISMVRPVLHMLLNTALKLNDRDLKEIGMAKEVISRVLSSTYSQTAETATFLNVAAFLDPRYKRLPFLTLQERSQVETKVIEEAKAVLEKQRAEQPSPVERPQSSDEPPDKKQALATASPCRTADSNPLAVIFYQSGTDENQEELHAQVVEELSNFKSQRVLGLNEDPLRWWSNHVALFPTLPKVLQKYWSVPATSVPCHRLFSSSGTILCSKRNRLAPAFVDQQVFLYENSRSYYEAEPREDDQEGWSFRLEQEPIA
ncbi:E3 SUMO-protein ligase ZBED1-like [Osmerus eperlanus]|uniref:E3 SUMO-protein ligase ZBED1-like n=1 Tax=Osmerus eperlanus TaxID=29151 RepID=UPI002E11A925